MKSSNEIETEVQDEVLLAPPYLLEHVSSSCGSVSSIGNKCANAISERETDQ
jgi:hypothetical protein